MQIGPYEILGELGRGGMGVVYRGRHPELDREFAIKVLEDVDPGRRRRFEREAQAAARAGDHPGIVAVRDAGVDDGRCWFAMDLVAGPALDEWIADGEHTPAAAARLVADAARAVHHAHQAGILHRDLKPANIMVETPPGSSGPIARVTDFGLASSRATDGEVSRLTHSDELLGTPAYMPPEQVHGAGLDARADVYALGATLYEVCTGTSPFVRPSLHATLMATLQHDPPPPSSLAPGLPAGLDGVIDRALAKAPEERYATAAELANDIGRALRGERIAGRTGARSPVLPWLAAGGVVALAAGLWFATRSAPSAPPTPGPVETEDTTRLAERGLALQQAWARLRLQSSDSMRRLEDGWHGLSVPDADTHLAHIVAVANAVDQEHPGLAVGRAWVALARAFAGDMSTAEQLLDAAQADAPDDPFPHIIRARLALAEYIRSLEVPDIAMQNGRLWYAPFAESPAAGERRTLAGTHLEAAAATALWDQLTSAQELADYVQGVRWYGAGKFAKAAQALESSLLVPFVATEASALRAIALQLGGRPAEAIDAWEPAAQRGWPRALEFQALSCLDVGLADQAGTAALERALAVLGRVPPNNPRADYVHMTQAAVCEQLAWAAERARQDPTPLVAQAIKHLEAALAKGGNYQVQLNLARVYRRRATLCGPRAEAGPWWDRALQAVSAAERMGAPVEKWQAVRGRLHGFRAAHRDTHGGDVDSDLELAVSDLQAELDRLPGDSSACSDLANALRQRAIWRRRRQQFGADADLARALELLDTAVAGQPRDGGRRHNRALVYLERGKAAELRNEDPRPDLERAVADFRDAAALEPGLVAALEQRGIASELLGEARERLGGDFAAAFQEAVEALGAFLAARPDRIITYGLRSTAYSRWGQALRARGADGTEMLERAVADVDALIARAPDIWRYHASRAGLLGLLERHAESVGAWERALELAPSGQRALVEAGLDRARRLAEGR